MQSAALHPFLQWHLKRPNLGRLHAVYSRGGCVVALEKGMFRYGKLARQAVSAMSYLAERHAEDSPWISSSEVGRARQIPAALAAKLLSEAASAGLARGVTGPGGGYKLARPPAEIRLADIVGIFEREMTEYPCPFGPGYCGTGNPCPLHHDFLRLEASGRQFLEETSLAVFAKTEPAPPTARRPARPSGSTQA